MDESTDMEIVRRFVPFLRADGNVTLREGGSMAIVAGGSAEIKEGGAGFCVVGGDLSVSQGGAGNMIVGGNAHLSEAGVGQMAAVDASVTDSRVGVLVAGRATLERSEILISTEQAIGFGVAAGVVFFVLSKLFGRK